jgi:hypothetical protein
MNIKQATLPIFSVLCFYLLLLTVGCSKTTTTPIPTNGTMTVTAGSTAFNAAQVDGVYSRTLGLMGIFGLTEKGNDSTRIILEFAYLPPVGLTFSSDTTETSLSYITNGTEYDAFTNVGRVIMTLTSADTVGHSFAGTFSGAVYNDVNPADSVVITNGKFASSYTVQN